MSQPASVTITTSPPTIGLDVLTTQLTAVVRDGQGRTLNVQPTSWSSADTNVATVDSAGLVTRVRASGGTSAITAHYNALAAAGVTVTCDAGSDIVLTALSLFNATKTDGPPTWTVTDNVTNAGHGTNNAAVAITSGQELTRTFYVKPSGALTHFQLYVTTTGFSSTNSAGVLAVLSGAGSVANFVTGAGTVTSKSITQLTDGWYKVVIVVKQNGGDTTSSTAVRFMTLADASTYAGVGDSVLIR